MSVTITDDDVFTALQAFILDVVPSLAGPVGDPWRNIRQGQQNDVPMPPGDNFVIMIPTDRGVLATTIRDYRPGDSMRDTTRSTRVGVDVNFYGDAATDNAQTFATLFRDLFGCDFLRPYFVQPLICDDGRQMPLIDSENQYLSRWLVHATMQINPTVSTSQAFADIVDVHILEADQL